MKKKDMKNMKKTMMLGVVVLAMSAGRSSSAQQSSAQQMPDCPDLVRALQDMVRADARMRDFANLRRYRDQNAGVKPGQSRVVFMGDSITDNWAQPRFGGFFPGKPYADRGISGQTTPQMLLRFRQDVVALGPEIVVILAGTNDVAGNTGPMTDEEIEGNLMSMSELAAAHQVRIVLSSILPVSDYHRRPPAPPMTTARPPTRIVALNNWMRSYAADHHLVYLDYYSAMLDDHGMLREDLSEDDKRKIIGENAARAYKL